MTKHILILAKVFTIENTHLDDKFQPFDTAVKLTSGRGYYYYLPTNTNGILIWSAVNETPKVNFKIT